MDIRCPNCSKLFRVADEKISGKGIRFKCSKCTEIITVTRSDFEADLLARESGGAAQAAPAPPQAPAPPVPPAPEPEAREYRTAEDQQQTAPQAGALPGGDQQIPPASLGDFDFSEPHAAAVAAANPEEGFGGPDLSFGVQQEKPAPEINMPSEAATEREEGLDFPVDLISEPKRKPAFGTPVPARPAAPAPEATPAEEAAHGEAGEETDLGAALAIPKEAEADAATASSDSGAALEPAPAAPSAAGPVFTPELLAQMKRTASAPRKAPAKAASAAEDDIDLGAALAMPRTAPTEYTHGASGVVTASRGIEGESSRKRIIIGVLIAAALVSTIAVLYFLGYLGGKGEQYARQPKPATQQALQEITPAGLQVANAYGYRDSASGDLIFTGSVLNTLDRTKSGWYLVIEVRDNKESVLATVRVLNGAQLYSAREYDVLAKRGVNSEDLKKRLTSAIGKGEIAARGRVDFEARMISPPAGSARFLPTLQSLAPESMKALVK